METAEDHEYFFESAIVDIVIRKGELQRRNQEQIGIVLTYHMVFMRVVNSDMLMDYILKLPQWEV